MFGLDACEYAFACDACDVICGFTLFKMDLLFARLHTNGYSLASLVLMEDSW